MSALHTAIGHLAPLADPNPGYNGPAVGDGSPPGGEGFSTVLGWAVWIVTGLCVLGIIITAGSMAISSRRGSGGEHAASLGWVLGACMLVGSATTIVGVLIT